MALSGSGEVGGGKGLVGAWHGLLSRPMDSMRLATLDNTVYLFGGQLLLLELQTMAREDFTITEKAPTRAFSWLKVATTAFTFKTLLRHFAKQTLTPQ